MDIPDDWWDAVGWNSSWTWIKFLEMGFKPTFDIPRDWWCSEELREALIKLGYDPPAASTRASQSSLGSARFEDGEELVAETDDEEVDYDVGSIQQRVGLGIQDTLFDGVDHEESTAGVGPLQNPFVVVPETNGLTVTADVGIRASSPQRRGGGVRAFFKKLVRPQ